jgi:hypothetical protein
MIYGEVRYLTRDNNVFNCAVIFCIILLCKLQQILYYPVVKITTDFVLSSCVNYNRLCIILLCKLQQILYYPLVYITTDFVLSCCVNYNRFCIILLCKLQQIIFIKFRPS